MLYMSKSTEAAKKIKSFKDGLVDNEVVREFARNNGGYVQLNDPIQDQIVDSISGNPTDERIRDADNPSNQGIRNQTKKKIKT
jgi:hypothetical protein